MLFHLGSASLFSRFGCCFEFLSMLQADLRDSGAGSSQTLPVTGPGQPMWSVSNPPCTAPRGGPGFVQKGPGCSPRPAFASTGPGEGQQKSQSSQQTASACRPSVGGLVRVSQLYPSAAGLKLHRMGPLLPLGLTPFGKECSAERDTPAVGGDDPAQGPWRLTLQLSPQGPAPRWGRITVR